MDAPAADSYVVAMGCQRICDLTQNGLKQTPLPLPLNEDVLAIVILSRYKPDKDSLTCPLKLNLIPLASDELWPCAHCGRQVSWKREIRIDPHNGIHEV